MPYKPLQKLMEKPLSRKDFLRHIGIFLLGMIGVGRFIASLSTHQKVITSVDTGHRFGAGKFGV